MNDDNYVNYFLPDPTNNNRPTPAVVAEGRIGDVANGLNNTFEMDIGKDTGNPAITQEYTWLQSTAHPFTLTYTPAAGASFTVSGNGTTTAGPYMPNPPWNDVHLHHDAIFSRVYSDVGGSSIQLSNLQLYTVDLNQTLNVPNPNGTVGPTSVGAGGANPNLQALQLSGLDLRDGFTLTGTSTWAWDPMNPPANSHLAFQIKVGTWIPPVPDSTPPQCTCSCSCSAGLIHDATGADGGNPAGLESSSNPVRYFDGIANVATPGLMSAGYGAAFGQSQVWNNQAAYALDPLVYQEAQRLGVGQVSDDDPWLLKDGQSIVAVFGSGQERFFDLVNNAYQERFFGQDTLVHNSGTHEFVLTDTQGDQFHFNDFSGNRGVASRNRGQLKSFTDPGQNVTQVSAYTTDGNIADVLRTDPGGAAELWDYHFLNGKVDQVTLQRRATSMESFRTVRQIRLGYYPAGDAHGNAGDLETTTVVDDQGGTIDTTYYRFYTQADLDAGQQGYVHGLKFVFGPQSFARVNAATNGDPFSKDDPTVAPFADNYFQYDRTSHKVTTETVQGAGASTAGGLGTYQFSYASNPANPDPGYNTWQYKATLTLPVNTTRTEYTNAYGELLLDVYQSGGLTWRTDYQYDSAGRIVLKANPSAVTGHSESIPDLVDGYLNGTGLYEITDYYGPTDTAPGYFKDAKIKRGLNGTPILLRSATYTTQTASVANGGATVHPVASETVYRNDSGSDLGPEETDYSYPVWYMNGNGPTTRMLKMLVMLPVVTMDQNGPGTQATEETDYDALGYGRVVQTIDPDGYKNTYQYDPGTGAMTQMVVDAGDATHLNLTTTIQVDGLGREKKRTEPNPAPNQSITYTVYLDTSHEVRTYRGWQAATNTPTGPTEITREYRPTPATPNDPVYDETLTMTDAPTVDMNGVPTGQESVSGVQTLSRTYTSAGGQAVRSDAYFDLHTNFTYATTPYVGTQNVNFYTTLHDFDSRGRPYRTTSPTLTVTQTDYDGLDRPMDTKVGTTTSSTLATVSQNEYDGGTAGDSNLTKTVQNPGGTAAARETDYYYDWRDRQVAEKDGAQGIHEDTATHRPIIYRDFDNLNEVTAVEQYDGDNILILINPSTGVPARPPESRRRARTATAYDNQQRVYQEKTFNVSQINGTLLPSDVNPYALTTNHWYDLRGDLVKTAAAGGLVTKNQYDGAGREYLVSQTDGLNDSQWSDALNVTRNNVLTQDQTTYDANGNPIFTVHKERNHDETMTGPLGDANTAPKARVSYVASYYDLANRLTATADVGTYHGQAYPRPDTVPMRSDIILVNSRTYNPAGWVDTTTDPRGIITQTTYDALERTTQTIEDYGTQGINRTTQYAYDGDSHTLTLIAVVPGQPNQVTQYAYNVRMSSGSDLDSNDLLATVTYPANGQPNTETYVYNALGETKGMTDRNNNVHTYTFDVLGRTTSDAVTPGSGVDSAVQRLDTAYDTGGRPYRFTSYADTGGATIVNQVQRTYNGLSQLIAEAQSVSGPVTAGTPTVQYAYSELTDSQGNFVNHSRLVSMTYPSGRVLYYNYAAGLDDRISRLTSLSDAPGGVNPLEVYAYLGLDTMVSRSRPQPGVNLTYLQQPGDPIGDGGDQYTGLDRFGRVVDQRWLPAANPQNPTDRFRYGYDRDGNPLYRDNAVNPMFGELYHASGSGNGYDNLNRLTNFGRGTLNATKDGFNGTPSHTQSWTLDAEGNWLQFTNDATTQHRGNNQQNQITSIDSGLMVPGYDANGNTTQDEKGTGYTFDAWNRPVKLVPTVGSQETFSYDALGRRIIDMVGRPQPMDLYYSASWQVLEEQAGGQMVAQYVWSPVYVDALVLRDTSVGTRLYVQQDANWNVTAVTDITGVVQERFIYDPYGAVSVYDVNWNPVADQLNWVYLHQGGRYDSVSGLYYFRNRDYSPTLGRWMQVDPMRYQSGNANLYGYVLNNPVVLVDPSGLKDCCGPDVTTWFLNDLVAHVNHAKKWSSDNFKTNLLSFRNQVKYLLSYKWMNFSEIKGCGTGRCVNTVELAGLCIRKNQLGNIGFGLIASLFPPDPPWKTKDAIDYAYSLPDVGTYWDKHPYASNYGDWRGKARMDNLAAYGFGAGLAGFPFDTPNAANFKRSLQSLFSDKQALNKFARPRTRIEPKDVTFIPEFKGFDTAMCESCGKVYAGTRTSIQYYSKYLEPAWSADKRHFPSTTPDWDEWIRLKRENYTLPTEPLN